MSQVIWHRLKTIAQFSMNGNGAFLQVSSGVNFCYYYLSIFTNDTAYYFSTVRIIGYLHVNLNLKKKQKKYLPKAWFCLGLNSLEPSCWKNAILKHRKVNSSFFSFPPTSQCRVNIINARFKFGFQIQIVTSFEI